MIWLVVAATVWLIAFAVTTGVWWPLIGLFVLTGCTALWLKPALAGLKRLALLLISSLALLALQLQANEPSNDSEAPFTTSTSPELWLFAELRAAAKQALFGVTPDAEALTLGLAIGDSSLANESLLVAMRDTSLTHLVAVSGSNCAIVAGAIFLALQKFGVRTRVFWSLLALLGYLLLVGPQPSVLRAAAMAAAILLAYLSGRKTNSLVALAISITVLVIANPEISAEYGFSLSVFATAGILLLAPQLYQRLKKRMFNWVAVALSVSAAAQLLCFPILLQMQPRLPTYSLAANLLAEPLVAPVTVLSILAVTLSWCQPLAGMLFWLASIPAAIIAVIAHTFAALPLASAFWATGLTGTIAACLTVTAVAALIVAKRHSTRAMAWLGVSVLCLNSLSTLTVEAVRLSTWPQRDWQIASCDVGQGDATVVRSEGHIAVIDVGKYDSKIERCLGSLGVSRIDLLVLTHFDQDHVLAGEAAIKTRQVNTVLISPFADDRPAALKAMKAIARSQANLVKVQKGLSGNLGSVRWQVLNPSKTAEEAEDSNDASIAMIFRFSDFSLLALADLGEPGQMRIASDLNEWQDRWVADHDLVLKVSHHGSADQYSELIEHLRPEIAMISVGKDNAYGHPTRRTLDLLSRTKSLICRTDQLGSFALSRVDGRFAIANTAAG